MIPSIGRGILSWELKALAFAVLNAFASGAIDCPEGVSLDDFVPKFSSGHVALIQYFGSQFIIHTLRNITNQSCNQPIRCPACVTNVTSSYRQPG